MKKFLQSICFIVLSIYISGYALAQEILVSGRTMGTTYHVKVAAKHFINPEKLKEKIDNRLKEINQSMSIFIKGSEISRFNALTRTNEKFYISDDFLRVMAAAKNIYKLSDGAWDGTIMPLVNLWGFNRDEQKKNMPSEKEIQRLLNKMGFDNIDIVDNRYLVKKKASVSVDLGSIAKGYGVDQVAELIKTDNIKNFIVEIGGEVYAGGLRKDGKNWKAGINRPDKYGPVDRAYKVVNLNNRALATSGNYRNFFEISGRTYSHVFDPKTGYPVSNRIVSASVIADNCTLADGLATALMVMGTQKGLQLVNDLDGVECLMVVREKDGSLTDYYSQGFH